jgi:hypothetical protein
MELINIEAFVKISVVSGITFFFLIVKYKSFQPSLIFASNAEASVLNI